MTTLTTAWHYEPRTLYRALGWLGDLAAGIQEGRALERRYLELTRLSPQERARRGISRTDFAQLALRGAMRVRA